MPGISEQCAGNAHEACVDPTCRCLHHKHVQEMMKEAAAPKVTPITTGNKRCPVCMASWKASDIYCRKDGTVLASNECKMCKAPTMTGDLFCWKCGAGLVVSGMPTPTQYADMPDEAAAMEAKARLRPSDVEVPTETILP